MDDTYTNREVIMNKTVMLKMALRSDVRKYLLKIHHTFKDDKQYSISKYIKLMRKMMEGERIIPFEDCFIISTFLPPFPSKAFTSNLLAVPNTGKDIFSQQMDAKRSAPISIYLCLTHKCPNNCIYCSAKDRAHGEELTTEQWKKTIAGLQDMGTSIIGLTGGEPLLRKDLLEIVASIDERSSTILFTSGKGVTYEKLVDLKKAGLFGLGISLDSHIESVHNAHRRDDNAFKEALGTIEMSRKAGLYTMAQTVILRENISEDALFPLFRLAKEMGAHEVKLLEPLPSGNLLEDKNSKDVLYSKSDRERLIQLQHKANRIKSMPKITSFPYTESKEKFGCGAGTQHSYISATGDLYPCDFVPMSFGNVRENHINKLWTQMNKQLGKPRVGCMASYINKKIHNKAQGQLPLSPEASCDLCKQIAKTELPDYYTIAK